MRLLLGQDQGRLWPTGDVAWCHSADAVTADTPHSEHWAISCSSWRSNGQWGDYWWPCVSPAQCPAWLRFVLSLDPWEGRAPACSEPQLSLNDLLASLLTTISHTIWHLMRSTDENGSTYAKCEGSIWWGVTNNNKLVFIFLLKKYFLIISINLEVY